MITPLDPVATDPQPLTASDLVVGCVTEDRSPFLAQACNLVRSIRWFGGELAAAEVVVCAVGGIEAGARRTLEALGAEVRIVAPFDRRNPFANKLQFLSAVATTPRAGVLLLDCDTLVVRDPLPLLLPEKMMAKIAPFPTVPPEIFARLFRHFHLPLPPAAYVNSFTATPTILYCNSGVVFLPSALARELVPVWRDFNSRLAARLDLLHPCERHCNQASLSLALAACPVPFAAAPFELNYQLNATHVAPPLGYFAVDPAILHYHDRMSPDGTLQPLPYPLAVAHLAAFKARLAAERNSERARPVPAPPAARRVEHPAQIVVLGMHRSGTSAAARILGLMGCWAGTDDDFPPADEGNPTGYWEHRAVWAIDEAALRTLGCSWWDVRDFAIERLDPDSRARLEQSARTFAAEMDRSGPWVIKDPRLCLLFPLWRRALERPVCVLVHRHPLAVARSLTARDGLALAHGIALWELYTLRALAATRGVPRTLLSYRGLLDAPEATVAQLRRDLLRLAPEGASSLRLPDPAEIAGFLSPALDRQGSAREESAAGYLNAQQAALLAALESGRVFDLDPVPPLSPLAASLITDLSRLAEQHHAEQKTRTLVAELDRLLAEVFSSHTWRSGALLARAFRLLRGKEPGVSAADLHARREAEIRRACRDPS